MNLGSNPLVVLATFLVGASVGSFLNVVIFRVPRGESVLAPRSRCPACGRALSFRDMIPVLSYLLLRGKCRYCKSRISPIYPLVESSCALLSVFLLERYGLTTALFRQALFLYLLLAITVIDTKEMLIPDGLVLSGVLIWSLFVLASPAGPLAPGGVLPRSAGSLLSRMTEGFAGALLGFLVFLVIALVTGGMGGGDVKFAGMCGLYLGPALTVAAIAIAFLAGGLAALVLLTAGKAGMRSHIPYGPFIALGAFVASLWGERIIHWYLGVLF